MRYGPRQLEAGPIRLILADGELRYLYVGHREVVRRIYFSVRFDEKWDTAPNEVTHCEIITTPGAFTVDLSVRTRIGPVDYGWTAQITGAVDGTLTYAVHGAANSVCRQIRRCGIQFLLGADAVIGQPCKMIRPDGSSHAVELPMSLDPEVLPMQFRELAYTTREGVEVSAEFQGTNFGYEDQRNFNDSSFKFFSANAHPYPTLLPGAGAESRVTLRLSGRGREIPFTCPLSARVGAIISGARMPRLIEAAADTANVLFYRLNKNRASLWDTPLLTWTFTPAVNLYDDDTFMENTGAVLDQLRTAREIVNPQLPFAARLDPVHFESLHARSARDSRNGTAFAAAWLACFVKYAAIGGGLEVAFRLGPGPVDQLRAALAENSGKLLRAVVVTAPGRPPIEAFGIVNDKASTTLVFANSTSATISLPVENISIQPHTVYRVSEDSPWSIKETLFPAADGTLALTLAPFEVCVLLPCST